MSDGRRVATASEDNMARVWDAATGQRIGPSLEHQKTGNAVAFSPDGSRVLTAPTDDTTRILDAGTGQPVGAPLEHKPEAIASRN